MFTRSISIALACMVTTATAQAGTVTVTQLTNNTIADTNFYLNNIGDVTWTAYEPGDTEVYLYDSSTQATIAITNNDFDDNGIVLNGQGDAVWMQYEPNPNSTAFGATIKKLMHRSSVDGAVTEIARSDSSLSRQQINNNGDIVWLSYDPTGPDNIFKYDAVSGAITNLSVDLNGEVYYPHLNARGDVVWLGYENSFADDADVYMYTESTGSVANISNNTFSDSWWYLNINNSGDVTWSSYDGIDSHIYRYDGTSGVTEQLTVANGVYDTNQWMNAAGDVVWNSGSNIALYDASTKTVTQLTNDALYRSNAVMDDNGNIVWQGSDANGTDTDMFFYDRAAGTIANISNNDVDDYFYWVNSHGDFAWSSNVGTATEIMFYSNTTKAVTQITNDTFEDGSVVVNDQLDMVWVKNDGDYEIMLGKVQTTTPLDFTYSRATQDMEDGEIKIVINSALNLPAGTDQITVSLDGVTVLDVPFSNFIADEDPGVFEYETAVVEAELDIIKGRFEIEVEGALANALDTSDGVFLEISIGNAAGAGQIQITPVDDGHDRDYRHHDRH